VKAEWLGVADESARSSEVTRFCALQSFDVGCRQRRGFKSPSILQYSEISMLSLNPAFPFSDVRDCRSPPDPSDGSSGGVAAAAGSAGQGSASPDRGQHGCQFPLCLDTLC